MLTRLFLGVVLVETYMFNNLPATTRTMCLQELQFAQDMRSASAYTKWYWWDACQARQIYLHLMQCGLVCTVFKGSGLLQ
jgi:hypothetical protein